MVDVRVHQAAYPTIEPLNIGASAGAHLLKRWSIT
jgi:hypothetical protein